MEYTTQHNSFPETCPFNQQHFLNILHFIHRSFAQYPGLIGADNVCLYQPQPLVRTWGFDQKKNPMLARCNAIMAVV